MKNQILIFVISLMILSYSSQAQMTFEHGTWAEVKAKAKAEKKHILVDAFTTWCGPCKWMSKNVFTDAEVGKFFNANYVNYKLDMEKGEGLDFAKTYNVRAYPTIVFFNPEGEMVHKSVGAAPPPQFLTLGRDALNPEKQVFTLKKKFEKGEKSPDFLKNYAYALKSAYENHEDVAKAYMATQNKKDWTSKENWQFIKDFTESMDSETFKFVLANKDDFKKLGEKDYNKFIGGVLQGSIYQVARTQDEAKLSTLTKEIKSIFKDDADRYVAQAEFVFHSRNAEKRMKYACKYLDNYSENWQELNSVAWNVFESSDNKEDLEKASNWAKKSIDLNENFYNTDTYANLLFKLEKYKDAKSWAEKAVEIGKSNGETVTETEALLAKIQEKLK